MPDFASSHAPTHAGRTNMDLRLEEEGYGTTPSTKVHLLSSAPGRRSIDPPLPVLDRRVAEPRWLACLMKSVQEPAPADAAIAIVRATASTRRVTRLPGARHLVWSWHTMAKQDVLSMSPLPAIRSSWFNDSRSLCISCSPLRSSRISTTLSFLSEG